MGVIVLFFLKAITLHPGDMAEHTETLVGKSVQFIGTAPFFGQKLAGQKRCRVDGRRREFIEAV